MAVISAEAIMVWFFLDISPAKTNYSDAYYEAARNWETTMVDFTGKEYQYINAYRQADV